MTKRCSREMRFDESNRQIEREITMPHVIVKLWPGKSEQQKQRLTDQIMRATVMYEAGEVRIANVPDARIINPTDALVKVTRACICGSDLWPYKKMEPSDTGVVMGHEAIGVVEDVGKDVRRVRRGD